jgi:hypothetical protein
MKRFAKVLIVAASLTTILTGLALWETRKAAIPGVYHVTSAWGSSTLTLRADHSFTQEVEPLDEYTGKRLERQVISGRWEEYGRRYLDQRIGIELFIWLGSPDSGKIYNDEFQLSYGPVSLTGLGIEVNIAAGIVYRK